MVSRSFDAQSNSAPAKTGSNEPASSAFTTEQSETNTNLSSVTAKKQDKAPDLANTNANTSDATGPDVKTVAQPAQAKEATAPQTDAAALAPAPPPKPEAPIVETRAPAPKTVEPPAEKKESKPAAKSNGKESDDKKKDEGKEKKKGGGFFKVFKKIFGKD
jgi:hypothetical protein